MKTDGRLARSPLKGTIGDALFAVLCGCGHNIRKILAGLRAVFRRLIALVIATLWGERPLSDSERGLIGLFRATGGTSAPRPAGAVGGGVRSARPSAATEAVRRTVAAVDAAFQALLCLYAQPAACLRRFVIWAHPVSALRASTVAHTSGGTSWWMGLAAQG